MISVIRKEGRPSKVRSKERLEGLLRLKVPVSRITEDLQVTDSSRNGSRKPSRQLLLLSHYYYIVFRSLRTL